MIVLGLLVLPGLDDGEWVRPAVFGAVLLISILVHELGHAVVAQRLGLGPCSILLHGFGGLCSFGRSPTHRQGLLVSVAGPAAGLVLGALALGLDQLSGQHLTGVLALAVVLSLRINLFWSLFNLLPMYPLDGGQALRHGLALRLDGHRARAITRRVSQVLAAALAAWGIYERSLFFVFLAALIFSQNRDTEPVTD